MTPMSAAAMGAAPVAKAGVASGGAQHLPPGRGRARDRDHGRDRRQSRCVGRGRRREPAGGSSCTASTFAMRISAAICFGAAIVAATLVRRYRHAEASQPLEAAA